MLILPGKILKTNRNKTVFSQHSAPVIQHVFGEENQYFKLAKIH